MTPSRPTIYVALAAVALLVAALLPGMAGAADDVIVLPGARSAEGIATGEGTTFYAGDLNGGSFDPTAADAEAAGDIYRGDYATGEAELFIDVPADGRYAVGMDVDTTQDLLFVAGGPSATLYVYSTATGDEVASIALPEGFANDVIVVDGGVWVTNSNAPVLTFVPSVDGVVGEPTQLQLSGPASDASGGFNVNGIEAVDADTLIVGHSELGAVFTVDATTGESAEIVLDTTVDDSGLVGADGILLIGDELLVVENSANRVVSYALADDLTSATLTSVLTDGAFDVPTTVAQADGDRIAVVNAKFGTAMEDSVFEAVVVDRGDAEAVGVRGARVAGPDRFATSVAVSQRAFPDGAGTAYLARADESADALSAGTLTDGPILLVPSCGELPTVTADELQRLGVEEVLALGGTGAVCDDVLDAAVAAASAGL